MKHSEKIDYIVESAKIEFEDPEMAKFLCEDETMESFLAEYRKELESCDAVTIQLQYAADKLLRG